MKKLLFSILILSAFCSQEIFAQTYFEGYILYRHEYFDLEGKNISKQMYNLHPKEKHYYINQGNYVELTATKIEPMKLEPERFQIEKVLGIN
jgi:hypothetical protein